jgi:copper(I)-binding protein
MKSIVAALLGALLACPAFAHEGVHVTDPFARIIGPSGAAYFRITNHSHHPDRLIAASSPQAGMVMIMTSGADENGVMKMTDLPEGIAIPGEDSHTLVPGADHVMLMEMVSPLPETVTLTLTFEEAGAVTIEVPVQNKRMDPPGAGPTAYDAASGEAPAAAPAPVDPHAHHNHGTP